MTMRREEDALRAACAQAAQEEAERLESSLTPDERRQAKAMYRHHRRQALALIRRKTHAHSAFSRVFLPVAAALLAILAGVLLTLREPPQEPVPLQQMPTASVIPYYSPVPSPSPTLVPPTFAPTLSPSPTISPTFTPNPTDIPSPAPTASPDPTQTPTLSPTEAPVSPVPPDWTGCWFPMGLPAVKTVSVQREENRQTAVLSFAGDEWTFTEYDSAELVEIPDAAAVSYVQWDGVVALRMADETGVTLAWTLDGRSFTLRGPQGKEADIAKSVKKISAE